MKMYFAAGSTARVNSTRSDVAHVFSTTVCASYRRWTRSNRPRM